MASTTMHATGTYTFTSWDEEPYAVLEGTPGLTHARVVNVYRGDLEGDGTVEFLMFYPTPSSATYLGFERVNGKLGGRSGSFVLQSAGAWEDGVARTTLTIVPGSGTGELEGLRGEGALEAGPGQTEVPYRLDCDFG
ncbi:MAG TPA: DUF3224 domain-containing protein [Candidatus Dormibacteraeota bacterium]|nr:DUF3224 domain-containing protein [Candidatus Dormibacteraeota bacterium]